MAKQSKKPLQTLRGMRDIMPSDWNSYYFIEDEAKKIAIDYNYQRIETPILEETSLYLRSVGEDSEIVNKEMYSFEDKGGDKVTVRPEMTAGVVRAFIEHGMSNLPQPVKLFYYGPVLRHERPQAGRYRQFYQLGFEIFGEALPVTDAEIITMGYRYLESMNIPTIIKVNTLGDKDSRTAYRKALVAFLKPKLKQLPADDAKRLEKNPLRILDSKEEVTKKILVDAPKMIDYLSDTAKESFLKVIDYLDDLELPYEIDNTLVRGLDYYTGTVFEYVSVENEIILPDGKKKEVMAANLALGGGGRYDNLVEQLGGRNTPAIGLAFGVERLLIQIRERNISCPELPKPEIFIGQIGDEARKKCFTLFEDLRKQGIRVSQAFTKEGIKAQLEVANRLGVRFTMILGQKELIDKTILIRDMENGIQETVDLKKAVSEIIKRLQKAKAIKEEKAKK